MKRVFAVLLMLAMILSAAYAEGNPGGEARYDYDELVVGTTMPMYGAFSLDNWGNSSSDVDVRKLIHGYNLVEWYSEEGKFRLDPTVVASGDTATKDGAGNHVYNLTLCEDLYYSDGTKITAWDYAFSWLLRTSGLIDEIGGKAEKAEYLAGWNEYAAGETAYLAGVQVTGDYQLKITISADYLPYFYETGLLDCYPYPIGEIAPGCEVADDGEGVYIRNAGDADGEAVFTADLLRETLLNEANGYLSHPGVVSGAYKLTSYDGAEARFELNEYYKGNSGGVKPEIPRIVFKVADQDTMIDEMLEGKYGLLNKVARADVIRDGAERGVGSGAYKAETYLRQGLSFITFNGTRAATAEAAVRQAIALCLDKDGVREDYVGEYGEKADGFYGLGQWMYQLAGNKLKGIETYAYDTERAAKILEEAGWTLNKAGEEYDSSRDEVRCKEIDGELVALELKLVYPESTAISEILENRFAAPLKEAGIALTVESSASVLPMYYGQAEADYDMLYLATNFDVAYDPSPLFMEGGAVNVAGVKDEELVKLAEEMRQTEEGDLEKYCAKWVEFQKKFAEKEPMIPVYSNAYYDFYAEELQNYDITQYVTWSEAIVSSSFGETAEETAP